MSNEYKLACSPQGPFVVPPEDVVTRVRNSLQSWARNGGPQRLKQRRKTIDRKLALLKPKDERKSTMRTLNFQKVVEQFNALLELTGADVKIPESISEDSFHQTIDTMLETMRAMLGLDTVPGQDVLAPGDGSAVEPVPAGEIPIPALLSLAHRRRRAVASGRRMTDTQVNRHLLERGKCPLKPVAGGYRSL